MSATATDWIGTLLPGGRYHVTAKLGEGGMGLVYKANDRKLDSEVVIKAPRRVMLEDPEFVKRFAREIRSLVKLSHPHIVKVTDVGQHDGLPYAVMQYLSGGSLEDRLPRSPSGAPLPMQPGALIGWIGNVAAALDFIHQQGYVHRDIKPGNILFDAHQNVFLSDFGVAKVVSDTASSGQTGRLTGTGMVMGTPDYMAPELIMGQPSDGRIDQYALAVMVYELLSGRLPFVATTPTAVMVMHTTHAPPPLATVLPSLPAAVSHAIQRSLEKDPQRRFPTCRDLAHSLEDALRGQPSSAPAVARAGGNVPAPSRPTASRGTQGVRTGTSETVSRPIAQTAPASDLSDAPADEISTSKLLAILTSLALVIALSNISWFAGIAALAIAGPLLFPRQPAVLSWQLPAMLSGLAFVFTWLLQQKLGNADVARLVVSGLLEGGLMVAAVIAFRAIWTAAPLPRPKWGVPAAIAAGLLAAAALVAASGTIPDAELYGLLSSSWGHGLMLVWAGLVAGMAIKQSGSNDGLSGILVAGCVLFPGVLALVIPRDQVSVARELVAAVCISGAAASVATLLGPHLSHSEAPALNRALLGWIAAAVLLGVFPGVVSGRWSSDLGTTVIRAILVVMAALVFHLLSSQRNGAHSNWRACTGVCGIALAMCLASQAVDVHNARSQPPAAETAQAGDSYASVSWAPEGTPVRSDE